MYDLPYFKDNDPAAIIDFIHQHPFALMAGCDESGKPVATQVPVFMEEREGRQYLSGHLMKNTDHHKAFLVNPHILCVFTGAHSYVSAAWYSNPHQASTWNYMSVHAKGKISFLGDQELVNVLKKTSLHFEQGDTASPTIYENLPDDYRNRLVKAIVAFEVEVEEINHVFKLSQNRDKASYENIIQKLSAGDLEAAAVAGEMKKRTEKIFAPEKGA